MTHEAGGHGDAMIRYGFYAGLGLATMCLIFTIVYISLYSHSLESSFEGHMGAFLWEDNTNTLACVVIARTALNKTLLQSCGVVGGIAFGFVGFSLFLLGVKGSVDAAGGFSGTTFSFKRLAPGTLIILAAMVLIGISENHAIPLNLAPQGSSTGVPQRPVAKDDGATKDIGPSIGWKSDDSQL
jgi:hypothetical protein